MNTEENPTASSKILPHIRHKFEHPDFEKEKEIWNAVQAAKNNKLPKSQPYIAMFENKSDSTLTINAFDNNDFHLGERMVLIGQSGIEGVDYLQILKELEMEEPTIGAIMLEFSENMFDQCAEGEKIRNNEEGYKERELYFEFMQKDAKGNVASRYIIVTVEERQHQQTRQQIIQDFEFNYQTFFKIQMPPKSFIKFYLFEKQTPKKHPWT